MQPRHIAQELRDPLTVPEGSDEKYTSHVLSLLPDFCHPRSYAHSQGRTHPSQCYSTNVVSPKGWSWHLTTWRNRLTNWPRKARLSQLAVILRGSHGVTQVCFATGNKILRILKSEGRASNLPKDRYHLIKNMATVHKHLERNRKERMMIVTEQNSLAGSLL